MKTFEKNITDRKTLVKRIEELTGQTNRYSFAPRMAYLFEGCAVEKDGTLTVEDGFDQSIINTLIEEGLIIGELETEEPETEELDEATTESPTETDPEETEDAETEETVEEPDDAETEEETTSEAPITSEEQPCGTDADSLTISLPMERHSPESLRRLLNMIYSRGRLLSKATGGTFHVDKELLDALDDAGVVVKREDFISLVNENGGMTGISFTEDKINFTGFPFSYDAEKNRALQQLTVMMNKHALNQKRIQAREITEENEKYIFRIWLVRMGMDGSEFKDARRILLENLSGHTAFRTKADEEKWKARQKEKRDALRAAKAAAKEAAE